MGFAIDAKTIAQAQVDKKRGKFDPKNYDLRPPIIGLFEGLIDNLRWQPTFSWDKRPIYVDGKQVEDGDLIVLAGRRRDPVSRSRRNPPWSSEVYFVETKEYNGGWYIINQSSTERAEAAHFVVKKTDDDKMNLIDVESKNALRAQGHWVGVHPEEEGRGDQQLRNVAFEKGTMWFERSGRKSFSVTNSCGNWYVNIDNRGMNMSVWPVKVDPATQGAVEAVKDTAGSAAGAVENVL
ncbi:hypothetical protein ACLMJK_004669 [Lecanora helva]